MKIQKKIEIIVFNLKECKKLTEIDVIRAGTQLFYSKWLKNMRSAAKK